MSNIEDDLKILENAIKCNKKQFEELGTHILLQDDEQEALEHLLSHYKNMKFNYENLIHDISLIAESLGMQEDSTIEEIAIRISEEMYNQQQINEEHQRINGELRERVKELEEENTLQRRQLNSAFDNGYIHTDKIRKLIENETIDISGFECIAVEDLQELLGTK